MTNLRDYQILQPIVKQIYDENDKGRQNHTTGDGTQNCTVESNDTGVSGVTPCESCKIFIEEDE